VFCEPSEPRVGSRLWEDGYGLLAPLADSCWSLHSTGHERFSVAELTVLPIDCSVSQEIPYCCTLFSRVTLLPVGILHDLNPMGREGLNIGSWRRRHESLQGQYAGRQVQLRSTSGIERGCLGSDGALVLMNKMAGILHTENESVIKSLKETLQRHLYDVQAQKSQSVPWMVGSTHTLQCHQFLVEQYREGLSDPRSTHTVTLPDFTIGKHLECPAGHKVHVGSNGTTWPCDCIHHVTGH